MQQIKTEIQRLEKLQPTDLKSRLAKLVALNVIYKTLAVVAFVKLQCQYNAAEKRAFKKEMQLYKCKFRALELPLIIAKVAYNLDVIHTRNSEISKIEGLRIGGTIPEKQNDSPFVPESEFICDCANIPPLSTDIPCLK